MRHQSEMIPDKYNQVNPVPMKFAVKFCNDCNMAWQLFRENSRDELVLSYFAHFKGKWLDKEKCPTCEKINLP